jgi:hypothetical protein
MQHKKTQHRATQRIKGAFETILKHFLFLSKKLNKTSFKTHNIKKALKQ